MRLYRLTGTAYEQRPDGFTSIIQIPTFYLDADHLGIVSSQHAETIGKSVCGESDTRHIHLIAYLCYM